MALVLVLVAVMALVLVLVAVMALYLRCRHGPVPQMPSWPWSTVAVMALVHGSRHGPVPGWPSWPCTWVAVMALGVIRGVIGCHPRGHRVSSRGVIGCTPGEVHKLPDRGFPRSYPIFVSVV